MLIAKNLNVSKIVDYGLLNLVSLLFILVNNILFFSGSTTYNIPLRLSGLLVVKRMQKKESQMQMQSIFIVLFLRVA